MLLRTQAWEEQTCAWPKEGRHVLAQFDENSVVVYQAYRTNIGEFAVRHGFFGGAFSLTRMSWIKPNFLWMMYRSGWATKENQEMVLAVTLRRDAFDSILEQAVPSTYVDVLYETREKWQEAVAASSVRLQWDPDHHPKGNPLNRRALQLGLRGDVLRAYAREWVLNVEDITPFVREQHPYVVSGNLGELQIPAESVYPVTKAAARSLGVAEVEETPRTQ